MQIDRSKGVELKDIPDMTEEEIQKASEEFYKIIAKNMDTSIIESILEENKQLKKKYENAVADYELEKYKNSKATEFIEKNFIRYKDSENGLVLNELSLINIEEIKKLLKILGDKENE